MPSNKYARRKFPDIDKTLRMVVTRLVEEYERIALNKDDLNSQEMKLLISLSRTLIRWRRESVFQNLRILHETKIKDMRPPEEQLMDILRGELVEIEDDENEEAGRDDLSTGFYSDELG